jgi:RHH-type proline utilization regulon transcriptional repressor/proline dehydrogenase/delta 1-pyrroline-5-carboxylate dehydrogenase
VSTTPSSSTRPSLPETLADDVVATVRRWLNESRDVPADKSAERLAGVLKDPKGLDFTLGFVDRVVRPEDLRVAGKNLERVSHLVPGFLPWYLRTAVGLGGAFAPLLPWPIIPIARNVLRSMVSHLVIDASPAKLDKSLAHLREGGVRLNLNLLGEAVLGDAEADRRLAGTRALLERDDVDYVSIKVSSIVSQLNMWAFDETVERVVTRLTPLYELAVRASSGGGPKFINLDMEEYRDLDLTIAVFTRLLDQPQLKDLEAGIVLQAYLPDALSAMQRLNAWATERRSNGGAGVKVRVVKGANLAMETVDATVHGWPLATWPRKVETDTNYKRVLEWALTAERTDAVRIGVAGHNLFDLAFAWLLASRRGVADKVEFEMLLGMATGQAEAVKREVGGLLLYTPVVHPHEFDSAISYLVRRLEENASPENFMSGLFDLAEHAEVFDREAGRFRASLAALTTEVPSPNRIQDRSDAAAELAALEDRELGFGNTADTDPAIAANRAWGRAIIARSADSSLGNQTLEASAIADEARLEQVIAAAIRAGGAWGGTPAAERAAVIDRAGEVLAAYRGRLIEVAASETGKTLAEGDVEVSEAIDFAHYYASQARLLDEVEGARFVPSTLTVVTPPWNFPIAIPTGSVLSALAAGSAVIIKPARTARRTAAVMVEALWEAGIPRELLTLANLDSGTLGRQLVAHPAVDRVILTGGYETAEMFRSWRPDLPLLAETSGKNAIIVTPHADLDLAVNDVVKSAFGHAGQKCSAASFVILVGSVARSERFRRQLVDAVKTLRVGLPDDPTTIMGPIIEPAKGKLAAGLTTLGEGESWLIEPRQLDDTGRLWSPGVRDGVRPGSEYHLTEYFGPILGIMTAEDLDEAIELQNAPAYGLTAGLHSLDPDEVAIWSDRVQAGNLYVNRGITGAIVRRQPFGGWKRSSVGAGAKAGGPNYLLTLGSWEPVESEPKPNLKLTGVPESVASVITAAQPGMDYAEFDRVRKAAVIDAAVWASEFGISRDVSQLGVERNVFRYRSVPVTLRLSEGAPMGDLVRLIVGATIARARISISSAIPLPADLVARLTAPGSPLSTETAMVESITVETDAAWLGRVASGDLLTRRVRLVGGSVQELAAALGGSPDVAIYAGPVTTAGRVELLVFLHEQAVSLTAHRFGNPDRPMAELPL